MRKITSRLSENQQINSRKINPNIFSMVKNCFECFDCDEFLSTDYRLLSQFHDNIKIST